MSHPNQTPQTRAAERAAINTATAAYLAAGGLVETVPASCYRKNHGLTQHRNGRTNLNLKRGRTA